MTALAWPLGSGGPGHAWLEQAPGHLVGAGGPDTDEATACSPTADAVLRRVWAQECVAVFARVTNLSIASTRVAVVGAGPIAASLVSVVRLAGGRLVVLGDDAPSLVGFALDGVEVSVGASLPDGVTCAFVTGENAASVSEVAHAARGSVSVPLVVVDAAMGGDDAPAPSTDAPRRGLAVVSGAPRETFLVSAAREGGAVMGRARRAVAAALAQAMLEADGDAAAAEHLFARGVVS